MCLIPAAIAIFEAGSTLYDGYQAAKTLSSDASGWEKAATVGGAAMGLFLPGPGTVYTKGGAKLGRWGWETGAKHSAVLSKLREAGDKLDLENIVPTRAEAERLIHQAGGTIERIERAHKVRGHPYPHINYVTASGEKATVQVESVGRQFRRNPE